MYKFEYLTADHSFNYNIAMIFVYDDGIHNNARIFTTAQNVMPNSQVKYCTVTDILDDCLSLAKLLIMPGGADLYYCEKLNGSGNQKIRDFVNDGGSYLGICAGAYYACSALDWNGGEIEGDRELSLYKGKATGPVFEWIENQKAIYEGSWIKAVALTLANGTTLLTHYNGGPIFTESQNNSVEVIARYTNLRQKPPAIIKGNYGSGKYILSSPHIEVFGTNLSDYLYTNRNLSYKQEKDELVALSKYTNEQSSLFRKIIKDLL
jgi:glutamine amidotransferase-like uncharacterized protein